MGIVQEGGSMKMQAMDGMPPDVIAQVRDLPHLELVEYHTDTV